MRSLQSQVRQFGYHVALGGGVINRGYSDKDLDLYFLPLDSSNSTLRTSSRLIDHLNTLWGEDEPIGSAAYPPSLNYAKKLTFYPGERRIDVFIL